MKKLFTFLAFAFVLAGCKKSETQYHDQDNAKTINDSQSDTIQTLPEISDTSNLGSDSANVKTDNE